MTTTQQKPNKPLSTMQPFRCICGIVLGHTDGKKLVIGGGMVWKTTDFTCVVCRHRVTWFKDRKGV